MAKVNWRVASNRRVIGDWVDIKSLAGIDARVKPRKYSQAGADEINAWAIQRQARLKRETVKALIHRKDEQSATEGIALKDKSPAVEETDMKDDMILDVLAAGDPELYKQARYMSLLLRFGIAEYQFGDEAGTPDDAWIEAVLDDVTLTAELLEIVKEFNAPLSTPTSDISATSLAGNLEV